MFLIEYIDQTKIKLINSETFEKTVLQISPDGLIGDGNITGIKVISSNPESGYARQNELLPRTWVNIYFGGDNVMFWGPLAWTVIYGLIVATFLTLVIVPILFFITHKIKLKTQFWRGLTNTVNG